MTDRPDALAPLLTMTPQGLWVAESEAGSFYVPYLLREIYAQRRLRAEQEATLATLREERDKWNRAARVLCGAHVGVPQSTCPVCLVEKQNATIARQAWVEVEHQTLRDANQSLADYARAQAQEIATLKAERNRLEQSLRDVRDRKDQRIVELVQANAAMKLP